MVCFTEIKEEFKIPSYLRNLVELLDPRKLLIQSAERMSAKFVIERTDSLFKHLASLFSSTLDQEQHSQLQKWNEMKRVFNLGLQSGVMREMNEKHENFFSALQEEIYTFRQKFATNMSAMTALRALFPDLENDDKVPMYSKASQFYESIFKMPWMQTVLKAGKFRHLQYLLRVYIVRGTISIPNEQVIGQVHRIAKDPQRNHMKLPQMESEIFLKQMFTSMQVSNYDYMELFQLCKLLSTFLSQVSFKTIISKFDTFFFESMFYLHVNQNMDTYGTFQKSQ